MAALEAMACEVPVIASRAGGLPELIDDGHTGFLCDMEDVDGMTARAMEMIGSDMHARAIGKAAAASVSKRFCVDKVVPMYEDYYKTVSGS
jgi:glycosyltransferase involved in cell wall biosynthesis